MKLGISSYTFGWSIGVKGYTPSNPMNAEGLLNAAIGLGIQLVQIADNIPLQHMSRNELQRLGQRASEMGIQVEIGTRGLSVERVLDFVRIAHTLNANLIRIVVDESGYEPSIETIVEILKSVTGSLAGLRLAIENHDRIPSADLRQIVELAASDRIGICLDTANSLGAGEGLETVLCNLKTHTINLHIKDFQITRVPTMMGFQVEGRPAGDGMLDISQLVRTIDDYGRCETAILELWTPAEQSLDETIAKENLWARRSINYLKPFFHQGKHSLCN